MTVRSLAIFFYLIGAFSVRAQVTFDRVVISPFAINASAGGIEFYSTGGQPEFTTIGEDPFFLTQGFEQPLDKTPLVVELSTVYNACTALFEYRLEEISGCTDVDLAAIWWDGEQGDSVYFSPFPQAELIVIGPVGCYHSQLIDASNAPVTEADCALIFYSFISPNGDGMNDTWVIEHINSPLFGANEVTIVGRWGEAVWSRKNYDNETVVWAGESADGSALPDGTYFYFVTIGDAQYTGYIELQR
jgi:gliding motility-associated-like protein